MEPSRFSKCCFLVTPSRARRVRFGPPDRLSPLGEVYLQPTLTTGHWTGEGGSRERGGEKMVWEPDRFNARVAHRLRGRPRFELIKARDLESLATERLSNARLRLTFYNAPVAYCGPARPGSAFQQSAVSGLLPRARARRADSGSVDQTDGRFFLDAGATNLD